MKATSSLTELAEPSRESVTAKGQMRMIFQPKSIRAGLAFLRLDKCIICPVSNGALASRRIAMY
jgi:hypothetical protein